MSDSASQYFEDNADALSLTPHERLTGKLALQARMVLSLTADEKTEGRRLLQNIVYADPAPVSAWSWLRMPIRLPATAFSILLLLGVSGGGLAYAAEGAMPGDTLYGVKIYVNEAVRAKLQFSAADRASWAITKLQRRMDELNRLQARGIAETDIDVAIADYVEEAAHGVEVEVESLPAAAAERAAARTAVNAAIGTDQDALRRASRVNRVLKALKERAERFDTPAPATIIAPVPSVNARARVENEVQVKVDTPAVDADIKEKAAIDAEADARRDDEPAADEDAPDTAAPDAEVPPLPTVTVPDLL